ncbi:MAG: hypothetical protein EOO01_25245 [Chitinophagaceae bacterium]|nr:MAG: hypothetical protein EOO01_25245 [Chitinophagaceae bacterium]
MVKIKDGYVMNAREQAEFDRVDALPRKKEGMVAYYFKPQTKYPPRIYVFMHAEIWCDRNRRPMGLHTAFPFLTRPMNREEIEYHHFDIRLCYHQYEHWEKLIYAEEQEAERLDLERAGVGSEFLARLKSFQDKYTLDGKAQQALPKIIPERESEEPHFINELIQNGHHYPVAEIGKMLDEEQQGLKRLPVLIVLRELYKSLAIGEPQPLTITMEQVERKAANSEIRTRRNLVRRVYRQNKLFALEEIRMKYPAYTEEMLLTDLKVTRQKQRHKKRKPVLDYRRSQLVKLAQRLQDENLNDKDYQKTCHRIVMLQQAHDLRLSIPKSVTYNQHTEVYSFNWETRESVIKSFVQQANTTGMGHEQLSKIYEQMTSSNYSF